MTLSPRPYQTKAIEDIRAAFARGAKRVVLVSPTGSGKTVISSLIGAGLHRNAKKAVYLGHRAEIVFQLGGSLKQVGIPFSYLTAATIGMPRSSIVVASINTLHRRKERLPIKPDLLFIDESHHSVSKTWADVVRHFPEAKVVGLTATPCRLDGKGLGDIFDEMVLGPHTDELIADGFLSDFDVYASKPPNLDGIHSRAGDYVTAELESAMRKQAITGDAVKHYTRLASGKAAAVFCVSVEHAKEVAEQFKRAGYRFESIDGKMGAEERRNLIDAMTKGRIHGLTSCDIISEGTDIPRIEVCSLLRPTKSLGLFRQQVGRSLRPVYANGFDLSTRDSRLAAIAAGTKPRALILDHAGNTLVHGLPDERIEWSLAGGVKRQSEGERAVALRNCPKCLSVHKFAPACPRCGHVYPIKSRKLETIDGDLELMVRSSHAMTGKPKGYWDVALQQLEKIALAKGYKKGWAQKVLEHRQKTERDKMALALETGVRAG